MPKEQINYPNQDEEVLGPQFWLHWSTSAGGYIQLSMEFDAEAMRDYLDELKKGSPMDDRAVMYSDELTRPEVQTLIKAARRARDAIFEADA